MHNETEVGLFTSEVNKRSKMMQLFQDATIENIQGLQGSIKNFTEVQQYKDAQATIKDGKEAFFGKSPETVINNTNQQAAKIDFSNTTERARDILIELLEGRVDNHTGD